MKRPNKFFIYFAISLFLIQCGNSFTSVHSEKKHVILSDSLYIKPSREIDSLFYKNKIWEMDSIFGVKKFIIPKYRLQILIALSFFPELKDVQIDFAYKNINTTMQCQPTINSLLKDSKREYIIYINNNKDFSGVLIDDVPFNAQIGLIGHEIAHVIDFEKGNRKDVISRGLDYLNESSKREYEFFVDSLTIAYGLGWQLYDWASFSLNNSKSTQEYKDFKRRVYMTPELILEQIKREKIYAE